MPIYDVSWTEELFYTARIEADSKEQAREMVFKPSFEWPDPYGFEIQDSVEVEEVDAEV